MIEIKTASEAFKDTYAQLGEAQKKEIAKAIDAACVKGLYTCFCKMTPEVATYLRGLGYSVDEQTNFGKIQGYQISWANNGTAGDEEPKEEVQASVEVTLANAEVVSDEDGNVVIDTIE